MRVPVDYRSSSREVFDKFREAYPDLNLSFEQWKEIVYTFNYLFRDYVLETGERAKLPWGLGYLAISKKKTRKTREVNGKTHIILPVDWKKTKEVGRKIYHLNYHTDGYKFKWYWFKKDARFYMSEIWVFKPSRVSSRKITEYVNKPNSHYSQIYKNWGK